jgi:hypothetical protein
MLKSVLHHSPPFSFSLTPVLNGLQKIIVFAVLALRKEREREKESRRWP